MVIIRAPRSALISSRGVGQHRAQRAVGVARPDRVRSVAATAGQPVHRRQGGARPRRECGADAAPHLLQRGLARTVVPDRRQGEAADARRRRARRPGRPARWAACCRPAGPAPRGARRGSARPSRLIQPTRALEPGSASSTSSMASKWLRLGTGRPTPWTAPKRAGVPHRRPAAPARGAARSGCRPPSSAPSGTHDPGPLARPGSRGRRLAARRWTGRRRLRAGRAPRRRCRRARHRRRPAGRCPRRGWPRSARRCRRRRPPRNRRRLRVRSGQPHGAACAAGPWAAWPGGGWSSLRAPQRVRWAGEPSSAVSTCRVRYSMSSAVTRSARARCRCAATIAVLEPAVGGSPSSWRARCGRRPHRTGPAAPGSQDGVRGEAGLLRRPPLLGEAAVDVEGVQRPARARTRPGRPRGSRWAPASCRRSCPAPRPSRRWRWRRSRRWWASSARSAAPGWSRWSPPAACGPCAPADEANSGWATSARRVALTSVPLRVKARATVRHQPGGRRRRARTSRTAGGPAASAVAGWWARYRTYFSVAASTVRAWRSPR